MYFFSIVIPVYNSENTLNECLKSISSQNFANFEVILVNDGCTDSSFSIVKQWMEGNSSIEVKIVEQENQGLGAARNSGVTLASGKYICFLDADDYWANNKLETLFSYLENTDINLLYHPVISFGVKTPKQRYTYPLKSITELLLKGNPVVPSAVCISKELAQKHPFSTNKKSHHGIEDFILWQELLARGIRFEYLPKTLTYYREEGGMSTQLDDHLRKVLSRINELKEKGLISEQLCKQSVKRKNYEAARFYHKRKNFTKAEKYYQLGFAYKPKTLWLRFLNFFALAL